MMLIFQSFKFIFRYSLCKLMKQQGFISLKFTILLFATLLNRLMLSTLAFISFYYDYSHIPL
jgi:hypothetical protein